MFSSNLTKFFALAGLGFFLFAGCRFWQKTNDDASAETPPVADELKSEIPYAMREPERFQAEILVAANGTERRTFIARDGAKRRWDFNFGAQNQVTNLQTDKNYLILPGRKIYTEKPAAQPTAAAPDEWADFLTTEWLSANAEASFEKMETTENLTKYRVNLGAPAANEVYIYIDETLALPVRQEFFAVAGGQKTLTYRFELQNIKLEPDESLFTVPADFRKVSAEEFGKILSTSEE